MTEAAATTTVDPSISSGGQTPPAGSHVMGPETDGSITVTGHPDNDTAGQDNSQQTLQPTPPQPPPQIPLQPLQQAPPATMQAPPKPTPPPIPAGVPLNSPYAYHPLVQQAGVQNTVARALAGGDRWRTVLDPNTGQMTRERIPMSKTDIGMSIALTALAGGLSGLAAKGPTHLGEAGLLGVQEGHKIAEERTKNEQQRDDQTDKMFSRQMQTLEANLKMHQIAQGYGKLDLENHTSLVNLYKDQLASIKENDPDAIDPANEHLSEAESKDVSQFAGHDWVRMPDGVVPRTDADGKPVYINEYDQVVPQGTPNSHQAYDNTYTMVHYNAALDLRDYSDSTKKDLSDYGQVPQNIMNGAGKVNAVGMTSKLHNVATLKSMQNDLDNAYDYTTPKSEGETASSPTGAWQVNGTKQVTIKDPAIAKAIDSSADKAGIDRNVWRAAIMQESGANPNVRDSDQGAQGISQILPATWKGMGLDPKDIKDTQKSLDAGAQYLRQGLDKYSGDYSKALQFYHGGPDEKQWGPKTNKYASDISQASGITSDNSTGTLSSPSLGSDKPSGVSGAPDIKDLIKGDRSYAKAFVDFAKYRNGHDNPADAVKAMAGDKNPRISAEANMISQAYGGIEKLEQYKQNMTADKQAQAEAVAVEKAAKLKEATAAQEAKDQARQNEYTAVKLHMPDNTYAMGPDELSDYLHEHGVKVPEMGMNTLWRVGHNMISTGDFSNKTWYKDAKMDRAHALEFIGDYIAPYQDAEHPGFDETNYAARALVRKRIEDPAQKNGGLDIKTASNASGHIAELEDLADAMDAVTLRGDLQPLNRLADRVNVAIGDTPVNTYKAVATAVGNEVSKNVAGDKPTEDTVDHFVHSLDDPNSNKQIHGVARAVVGLMNTKVKELDEESYAKLGQHLGFVGSDANKMFQKYGMPTPWISAKQTAAQKVQLQEQIEKLPRGNGQRADKATLQQWMAMYPATQEGRAQAAQAMQQIGQWK